MNDLLIVIDCQNAFVNNNTEKYVDKINLLIKSRKYNHIVFTKYMNYSDSMFVKRLNYNGCMSEDEQEIVLDTNGYKVFEKTIYSAYNNELSKYIKDNEINRVFLCGFDTEACVLKTALDMFENDIEVFVLKDYTMTTAGENMHNNAIEILKRLIGNKYII